MDQLTLQGASSQTALEKKTATVAVVVNDVQTNTHRPAASQKLYQGVKGFMKYSACKPYKTSQ